MQTSLIDKLGLEQGRYILLVSRLVPEKRHHDLIDAFLKSEIKNWKLVLVGSSDHPDSYSQSVLEKAKNTSGVITPGFLKGRDLNEIYSHAGLFVLPSSHEGLPIALLEALSFGLPTLASDIPSNKEVDIQNGSFFELGNIEALSKLIIEFTKRPLTSEQRNLTQEFVRRNYDWQKISIKTLKVYINTLGKNHD
jgi:glycosyltransferase involved in cell wall biosynthesis